MEMGKRLHFLLSISLFSYDQTVLIGNIGFLGFGHRRRHLYAICDDLQP